MMRADAIARILRIICDHESFFITSHARPDGDAIGSALGLMHLLESMGKRVTVAFADRIPTIYRCLPGIERIVPELPDRNSRRRRPARVRLDRAHRLRPASTPA